MFAPLTGLCALALAASLAIAGDDTSARADAQVLTFADAGARFHVDRDATDGTMTFRLADDSTVKITEPPVVTLQTPEGPREITLVAVQDQPGAWRLDHESIRTGHLTGSMKILVDGTPHTANLPVVSAAASVASDSPAPVPAPAPEAPVREEPVPAATPASLDEPMVPTAAALPAAKFGGRVIALGECGGAVEIVEDASAGTMKVYSHLGSDVVIDAEPVLVLQEAGAPRTVTLTKLEGDDLGWTATGLALRADTLRTARLRMTIAGKSCEAPLVAVAAPAAHHPATGPASAPTAHPMPAGGQRCPMSGGVAPAPMPAPAPVPAAPAAAATKSRGGQVVVFDGGPRFEVVRDPAGGSWTFYQLDDSVSGRPVVFEQPPVVVVGDRNYPLTRVEGDPRAWRLAGLDAGVTEPGDARMRVSLFGRSLETQVGLSGIGVGVR